MKKYIVGVLAIFFCLTLVVRAQGVIYDGPGSITRDLSVGTSGEDVKILQVKLIALGFDIPAITSGAAQKGYFGAQTKAAVIKYQFANGIPGTGYFGPLSRAKFWNGNNPGQSLQVTSPNGGETLVRGTTQTITWTGAQGILNQTGSIKLQFELPACADPANGPIRCMIATRAPMTLASNINLANRSWNWTVGRVELVTDCFTGNTCIPDGKYKVQICSNDSSVCDTSDNYFTIGANTTNNLPPVITSLDAPTTLTVGQTGTWKVNANDPQGSTLSYYVDWGDYFTYPCPSGYICDPLPASASIQQNSSFTHSFSRAGTYTVRFTVRNSAGLQAQSSATVTITNKLISTIPQVTSPNGGEVWTANTNQYLRWTTTNVDPNAKVDLYLDQANIYCIKAPCGQTFLLDKNIPVNQLYYWIVATDINNIQIMPADYKFRVCLAGTTDECDSSDKYFTIK